MKVRDVMTKQTAFCGPETNLAQAARYAKRKWAVVCDEYGELLRSAKNAGSPRMISSDSMERFGSA